MDWLTTLDPLQAQRCCHVDVSALQPTTKSFHIIQARPLYDVVALLNSVMVSMDISRGQMG